jgi:hypothetical protein
MLATPIPMRVAISRWVSVVCSIRRRTAATSASVCGQRRLRFRGPTMAAGPSAGSSGRTLRRVMEGKKGGRMTRNISLFEMQDKMGAAPEVNSLP